MVYSYCGEGNILEWKKNWEGNEAMSNKLVESAAQFLIKSLMTLDAPFKYLTN